MFLGSEHHINGRKYDFEAHLVHKNANLTKATVLGFLFEVDL